MASKLVWTDATPAQVQAALAGLAAQPKMFLAFAVNPEEESSKDLYGMGKGYASSGPMAGGGVAFQFEQRVHASGDRGKTEVGQIEMNVRERKSGEAEPEVAADQPAAPDSTPRKGIESLGRDLSQPSAELRVLFVLNVTDEAKTEEQ